MKKRYSEEQIIKAIKQHEAGAKVDDICRDMGITSGTFYNWRSKADNYLHIQYFDMSSADARIDARACSLFAGIAYQIYVVSWT